jgi:hypothetical protein
MMAFSVCFDLRPQQLTLFCGIPSLVIGPYLAVEFACLGVSARRCADATGCSGLPAEWSSDNDREGKIDGTAGDAGLPRICDSFW